MRAFPSQPHAHKGARILCCGWEGENPRTPGLLCLPHAHKGARILCCGWKGENPRTPRLLCLPHAHKGARILCCGWEGENPRTPRLLCLPHAHKGARFPCQLLWMGSGEPENPQVILPFVVDVPTPPPRGRSARSAPCASAELCLFSTVPATFQQPVLATFWRRSNGHWNVARTSPEQGVWVGLASLAHPCLQYGMTETEALGATLAAPAPPAPPAAQGATRSEPRSSSTLASPAPPPPQGAPKRPP